MTDADENGGGGRPQQVSGAEVLEAFGEVDAPVATARMLAAHVPASKDTVLRRLRELHEDGQVERLRVGGRAIVWWPTE